MLSESNLYLNVYLDHSILISSLVVLAIPVAGYHVGLYISCTCRYSLLIIRL